MTFGKVIGGGLPVGAFGGRAELMGLLAPAGPVYQAGTLSGNPLATAAGLATFAGLDEAAYETIAAASTRLQQLVRSEERRVGKECSCRWSTGGDDKTRHQSREGVDDCEE